MTDGSTWNDHGLVIFQPDTTHADHGQCVATWIAHALTGGLPSDHEESAASPYRHLDLVGRVR